MAVSSVSPRPELQVPTANLLGRCVESGSHVDDPSAARELSRIVWGINGLNGKRRDIFVARRSGRGGCCYRAVSRTVVVVFTRKRPGASMSAEPRSRTNAALQPGPLRVPAEGAAFFVAALKGFSHDGRSPAARNRSPGPIRKFGNPLRALEESPDGADSYKFTIEAEDDAAAGRDATALADALR
jgi:hypothetical protein